MATKTGKAPSLVILTGAGISAESGIPTFRASDGLWHNHRVEEVASPEGYARNPALVQQFYNERRRNLLADDIKPNAAHVALAELQKKYTGHCLLVTQNIDDLHERAGSSDVVHMHGELLKMRCTECQHVSPIKSDIAPGLVCARCKTANTLRPHIVWFGEMPLSMPLIEAALLDVDIFIAIGTSGNVYPAAGFVDLASRVGARTIEVNLEPTAAVFKERRLGTATDQVPLLVSELLSTSVIG